MPAVITDYISWLGLRRARVIGVATELALRAERAGRPLRPDEMADYRALDAARVHLDNQIRLAQLARRADPGAGTVGRWARQDPACGSMAVAPGSGSRATLDALRR